jgi:hypothetical protein
MCAEKYEDACTFMGFANWVVPGHLMLGRYPFISPGREISRELGEQQLKDVIQSGITTFVCLQV